MAKRACVVVVHNALEHHVTLVYRTVFLGETLALIDSVPGWQGSAHDTLIDGLSLTDIIELAAEQPDCVFVCGDVHHSRVVRFVADVVKDVSPSTAVFAFGRSTTFIPQFFDRPPFDAFHESGDREVALTDYLRFLDGDLLSPAGARIVGSPIATPGQFSSSDRWAFPDLDALPIEGYRSYVRSIYGDHYTPRISATIGKGCTWGCEYCGATEEEGGVDRRREPGEVVEWAMGQPYLRDGFSFHLYHPNLFADSHWVEQFSQACLSNGAAFSWRGVTTTVTLKDADLVSLAGKAGCTELAIGIETIDVTKQRSAKSSLRAIERAAANARSAGISLKGLVMAGYPGQSSDDLAFTEDYLTGLGMSVRYTGYTPLHELRGLSAAELDQIVIERFDRRTYLDPKTALGNRELYSVLTRNNGYAFAESSDT